MMAWREDKTREVGKLIEDMVRAMVKDADKIEDAEEAKAARKWGLASQSLQHIQAIETLSKNRLSVSVDSFNRDPYLFNTPSGAIDLASGERVEITRQSYVTLVAGARYDPSAKSEVWQRFLKEMTRGNEDLERFIQKAVGYSLTGNTREECMFFVYGPTATGKSTFLDAVKAALGDYAAPLDIEALLSHHFGGGGPSPELAKLRWKRMVVSVEVEEGKRFAESLIKLLTGGDEISVRDLYQSPQSFRPEFKLWIAANNRPKVSDVDDAIWRRIVVLPFDNQIPRQNRDSTLKERLRTTESEAILAWAVAGTHSWRKEGLGRPPKVIEDAVAAYQKEVDPLDPWIEECVKRVEESKWTLQTSLYESYKHWSERNGQRRVMPQPQFVQRLESHGFGLQLVKGSRVRTGILLITEKEPGF